MIEAKWDLTYCYGKISYNAKFAALFTTMTLYCPRNRGMNINGEVL